jgi:hypothetical protein
MSWFHAIEVAQSGNAAERGRIMGKQDDRAFHLERAEQCRKMAEEASDPAVRNLHEQLAQFHEAEAHRDQGQLADSEDLA